MRYKASKIPFTCSYFSENASIATFARDRGSIPGRELSHDWLVWCPDNVTDGSVMQRLWRDTSPMQQHPYTDVKCLKKLLNISEMAPTAYTINKYSFKSVDIIALVHT